MDALTLNRQVEGLAASHQRLLSTLDPIEGQGLTDEMVRRPSRLPNWTVGHVLTHLARHADSFTRLTMAAENAAPGSFDPVDQYPGGVEIRNADIEAGATRGARDQMVDLRRSIYELEGAWVVARRAWFGRGRLLAGFEVPISELPLRRWREVEVHIGDLGLDELGCDGPDSWSAEYVRHDLTVMAMQWRARGPMGMTELPTLVLRLDPAYRLAWLLGRFDVEGVASAGMIA
ncbi:MAG: maleylpyruvate isomerase N-terminal domain-containing protein [Actinobacteria bacterium]|nr:maleylpyruvate isomerase N-terminal domain-containing protein [Actinomycetota bacterium]